MNNRVMKQLVERMESAFQVDHSTLASVMMAITGKNVKLFKICVRSRLASMEGPVSIRITLKSIVNARLDSMELFVRLLMIPVVKRTVRTERSVTSSMEMQRAIAFQVFKVSSATNKFQSTTVEAHRASAAPLASTTLMTLSVFAILVRLENDVT